MRALLPSWVITGNVIELQKALLDTWKFFRIFLNKLTANDKYSLNSKDKWMQNIQMLLSQKQNIFFWSFFFVFWMCIKFGIFSEKDEPHSLCISEITDHERRA